jgi:hypothetical protein
MGAAFPRVDAGFVDGGAVAGRVHDYPCVTFNFTNR